MFDFIRKPTLWSAWRENWDKEIGKAGGFQLKSMQDLAIYSYIRDMKGKRIAEIGGGRSRILETMSKNNECFNIEKFDGADGGPQGEIKISGVENITVFLGEFSENLQSNYFDVLFSVSVVEHVQDLDSFLEDGMRILKPGGMWLHAIDLYVEDNPESARRERFEAYRSWLDTPSLTPLGPIFRGPMKFTCDMATNPDNIMYAWGRVDSNLVPLRQRAQSVSLLVAATKTK